MHYRIRIRNKTGLTRSGGGGVAMAGVPDAAATIYHFSKQHEPEDPELHTDCFRTC